MYIDKKTVLMGVIVLILLAALGLSFFFADRFQRTVNRAATQSQTETGGQNLQRQLLQ